ncbi:hypothetical protein ZWY2020_023952 [Hordeum vulgare]|nr:hypothetical protein ZWY2020_023952 [Hordeum vulgare]
MADDDPRVPGDRTMADDEEEQMPFFSQFSSAGGNLGRGMGFGRFLDLNSNVDNFPELGSYQQLLFDQSAGHGLPPIVISVVMCLHLHCIQIIGDLPCLLSSSCSLEDFEMIACRGVTDQLNIPHPLDKLRRLLLSNMDMIRTVHSHFEYKGLAIPIVLGGCSKLHSVTLDFHQTVGQDANNKVMGHVFHGISGVSAVKVIKATTRPSGLFRNLRHLTYDVTFIAQRPNSQSGILQLAQYLAFAPRLETLEVHMTYLKSSDCWIGEGISYRMCRHDHLKTVYMSGFQCYRPEIELLYVILDMGAALQHVTIEPRMRNYANSLGKPKYKICEWADRTSQRFGKVITVVE